MTFFPRAGAHPFSADQLATLDQLVPYNPADSLQAVSRLRARGISAEDSSALLTQARLRTLGATFPSWLVALRLDRLVFRQRGWGRWARRKERPLVVQRGLAPCDECVHEGRPVLTPDVPRTPTVKTSLI